MQASKSFGRKFEDYQNFGKATKSFEAKVCRLPKVPGRKLPKVCMLPKVRRLPKVCRLPGTEIRGAESAELVPGSGSCPSPPHLMPSPPHLMPFPPHLMPSPPHLMPSPLT